MPDTHKMANFHCRIDRIEDAECKCGTVWETPYRATVIAFCPTCKKAHEVEMVRVEKK